jgi:hypothetical protein
MEDIKIVEPLETQSHMDECFPDSFLIERGIVFLVSNNFLVKVSIIEELHDYAA